MCKTAVRLSVRSVDYYFRFIYLNLLKALPAARFWYIDQFIPFITKENFVNGKERKKIVVILKARPFIIMMLELILPN